MVACSRLQDSGDNGSKKICEKPREGFGKTLTSFARLHLLRAWHRLQTMDEIAKRVIFSTISEKEVFDSLKNDNLCFEKSISVSPFLWPNIVTEGKGRLDPFIELVSFV